jgi:hypothetical protein
MDILVFKVSECGEYYAGHIPISNITRASESIRTCNVKLQLFDARLVILANARGMFTPALQESLSNDSVVGTVDKKTVLERFQFYFTEPWNVGDVAGAEVKAFPMYGESDVIDSLAQEVGAIQMIRSVARIDVNIGTNDVLLDSVFVYHAKNHVYLAPFFDDRGMIIESPHIPADALSNPRPFGYKFENTEKGLTPTMTRKIYLAEDGQSSSSPTVLVVKTVGQGRPAYYYRVDMRNSSGDLIPILRNCRYLVRITEITGVGYLTADEAAAAPANTNSTVEADEVEINEIEFNAQYYIGVNQGVIPFRWDGSWEGQGEDAYFTLNVLTTYFSWSAQWDPVNFSGWLHITGSEGVSIMQFPASVTNLKIRVLQPNETGVPRSGNILLKAGTLSKNIIITQDIKPV